MTRSAVETAVPVLVAVAVGLGYATASTALVGNATTVCLGTDPVTGATYTPCQQRTRLTGAFASSCGAVWSQQPVRVDLGFQATFSFQVSNATGWCPHNMNAYKRCRARGGHGLALVLHNDPTMASLGSLLGSCLEGLGYTGINNSLAVELDMWHDDQLYDMYDNHMAIQTMSTSANTNDHRHTYGGSPDIPDLASGQNHTVRLVYEPTVDITILQSETCAQRYACDRFQSTAQFASMLPTVYASAPGMGTAWAYLDDMVEPRFIVPIYFPALLNLTAGTSLYVGLTAATGAVQFQVHDVFGFTFCSGGTCSQILP
ncbi:Bacterial lectin [Plasmodiophora brassicae]